MIYLWSFSSDSSCQLDVLWHDSDALGMNGAEVSVFEDTDQVCVSVGGKGWPGLCGALSLALLSIEPFHGASQHYLDMTGHLLDHKILGKGCHFNIFTFGRNQIQKNWILYKYKPKIQKTQK